MCVKVKGERENTKENKRISTAGMEKKEKNGAPKALQ